MHEESTQLLKAKAHDLIDYLVGTHRTSKNEVYIRLAKSLNIRVAMAHFSTMHSKTEIITAITHLKRMKSKSYWRFLKPSSDLPPLPLIAPEEIEAPVRPYISYDVPLRHPNKNILSQAEINRLVRGQKPQITKRRWLRFIPNWFTKV